MRSNRVLLALAAAGATLILSACSLPAPDPFPRSALQSGLDRLVDTQAASAAMLRIREGEHEWAAGAGTQELTSTVPVSTSGRFRIGSVTKTRTLTATRTSAARSST